MLGSKPVDTPMDLHTKLIADQDELLADPGRYRRLVGKLNSWTQTTLTVQNLRDISSQYRPQFVFWKLEWKLLAWIEEDGEETPVWNLVIEPIGLSGGMSSGRLASILRVVKHHRTLWMCKFITGTIRPFGDCPSYMVTHMTEKGVFSG